MTQKTEAPKEIAHSARPHHPYSPSQLQYLEASPAYIGRDNESEASRLGTLQHEAVESGNFDDLTDEQIEKVEFCQARKMTMREELADAAGCKPEELIELTEQYLPIDRVRLKDGTDSTTAGFLDFALVSPCKRFAAIVDWKFGKWQVADAHENLQGIGYLLGLLARFPTLEAVHVEFQMPYLEWETAHVFEAGDRKQNFSALYGRVCRVVDRAVLARMTADAGKPFECEARPSTCSFCARIGTCPHAGKLFTTVAAKLNEKLSVPVQLDPKLMNDPEEAAIAMRFANTAEIWGQAVRRVLSDKALEDKRFIPTDYSLQIRNDRVLLKPEPIIEELKRLGATPEEITNAYTTSLTALGKIVRAHSPRGEKDSNEKSFFQAAEEAGYVGREPETKIYLQAKRKSSSE